MLQILDTGLMPEAGLDTDSAFLVNGLVRIGIC
jgi:hypothetical protein